MMGQRGGGDDQRMHQMMQMMMMMHMMDMMDESGSMACPMMGQGGMMGKAA